MYYAYNKSNKFKKRLKIDQKNNMIYKAPNNNIRNYTDFTDTALEKY